MIREQIIKKNIIQSLIRISAGRFTLLIFFYKINDWINDKEWVSPCGVVLEFFCFFFFNEWTVHWTASRLECPAQENSYRATSTFFK